MKKLKLELDELRVESFATAPPRGAAAGTVHGRQVAHEAAFAHEGGCGCSCCGTCDGSCYGSCGGSTCDRSCIDSCLLVSCGGCDPQEA